MRPGLAPLAAFAVALGFGLVIPARAQLPLVAKRDSGQSVTPAYEGWYPNVDGTKTLSFGYYNRNLVEVIDIPIGPRNFVSPGAENQGQPSRFHPQRHWGVFTIRVPADFGDGRVIWTLVHRGETWEIPGHLQPDWLLDAKRNPASGNAPPSLRFEAGGDEGIGPDGIGFGPLETRVGKPLEIRVWATDDEIRRSSFVRQREPIVLTWFKHQGPGDVEISETSPGIDKQNAGLATTTATFSEPGDYVLRVRANDFSGLSGGGHAQCCWTNGYLKVTVSE